MARYRPFQTLRARGRTLAPTLSEMGAMGGFGAEEETSDLHIDRTPQAIWENDWGWGPNGSLQTSEGGVTVTQVRGAGALGWGREKGQILGQI